MKLNILIILIILFIGCSCPTDSDCVNGTIYVAGNEPFTYLAFSSNDDYYRIECSDSIEKELWEMQGQIISICDYDIELIEL